MLCLMRHFQCMPRQPVPSSVGSTHLSEAAEAVDASAAEETAASAAVLGGAAADGADRDTGLAGNFVAVRYLCPKLD